MAKFTTVGDIKRYAEENDTTLEELAKKYEMICFMGLWDLDEAEVIVPDSMPVEGLLQGCVIIS